jgi:hypothetical protein
LTTIITWRKERRERDHASLDLEKKKLELEKLRREIDKPPRRKTDRNVGKTHYATKRLFFSLKYRIVFKPTLCTPHATFR